MTWPGCVEPAPGSCAPGLPHDSIFQSAPPYPPSSALVGVCIRVILEITHQHESSKASFKFRKAML